jgi:hypothetical protein
MHGAPKALHDHRVRRDTLGRQHALKMISGMKCLKHGQRRGQTNLGFKRLLVVPVPDGGDHRPSNFLGK